MRALSPKTKSGALPRIPSDPTGKVSLFHHKAGFIKIVLTAKEHKRMCKLLPLYL